MKEEKGILNVEEGEEEDDHLGGNGGGNGGGVDASMDEALLNVRPSSPGGLIDLDDEDDEEPLETRGRGYSALDDEQHQVDNGMMQHVDIHGGEGDDDMSTKKVRFSVDPEMEMRERQRRRKKRKTANRRVPRRPLCVAAFLGVSGLIFLILSIILATQGSSHWITFLIVGILVIIPGAYQLFILYQAWRRVPGYSFNQLPSYGANDGSW